MKLYRSLIPLLVLVFTISLSGQEMDDASIPHEESLMKAARQFASATEKLDWNKVIDMTYPPLVKLNGGREILLRQAKLSDQNLRQQEFELKKVELSAPLREIPVGDKFLAIVPIRLTFNGPLGKLYSESSLLGVSGDDGKSWSFISMAQADMNQVIELFPELPKTFVIPQKRVYQE
ncbi:MAG: hypothetical protein ACPF9D_02160 [Owenweeksia sp.]